MPRWVLTCPNCSHESTHTEIDSTMLEQRNPFGVLSKPEGGKTKCPNCNKEFVFAQHDLFYREDARGQPS
jgi:endogenous inhibitor of DNA gyrase (YacG/DUF329 family)